MSDIVEYTTEKNATRATAIRESLGLISTVVERSIITSEIAGDIFGAHTRLRKIQRILLEAESRIDEVINP